MISLNHSHPSPTQYGKGGLCLPSPHRGGVGGEVNTLLTKQLTYPEKLSTAKALRSNMTVAERLMWEAVRRNSLAGFHFRRQHVIAGFIVDFYCHAARLIIEIDGPIHEQRQDHDAERSQILESAGLRVIRFTNDEVLNDLPAVLQQIRSRLRPNPPTPFPGREGGGSEPPPLIGEGVGGEGR